MCIKDAPFLERLFVSSKLLEVSSLEVARIIRLEQLLVRDGSGFTFPAYGPGDRSLREERFGC